MKIKILFIGKLPGISSGGLEKYHEHLIYNLLEDGRFNVSIITDNKALQITDRNVNIYYVKKPNVKIFRKITIEIYFFIIFIIKLPFLLIKIKPDIVHIQYGNIFDPFYAFIANVLGYQTIITMHVSSTWKHYKVGILKRIVVFMLAGADKIVCISKGQMQLLHNLNIDLSKVVYIPLSIDNIFFDYPSQTRNNDVTRLLYLGRICREKGIVDLLMVYKNLRLKLKNIELMLVGPIDSNFRSTLNKITNNKVTDGLKILDPIYDNIEKVKLYDKASIFIHPSYTDTMPISLIEALSRGCIIVATNIASIPELIESVGVLVEPGDVENMEKAIVDLSSKLDKLNEIREKGIQRALKYRSDNLINSYVTLYNSLIC